MKVELVENISGLEAIWPHVAPMLQRALDKTDDGTGISTVLQGIMSGDSRLWFIHDDMVIKNAFVTTITTNDTKKIFEFLLLGADDIETVNKDTLGVVLNWAKANGATRADILGRLGWERYMKDLGFRKTHVLISREL